MSGDDLGDDELLARLRQRGVAPMRARRLVANRDNGRTAIEIDHLIGGDGPLECGLCAGEGVIDGLLVDDGPTRPERCARCSGTGREETSQC